MAVLGRLLVSSAERLDLPDLLSLDSYASGDWKYFLKGLVGDTKPYILKGFDVIDPSNAIGTQSCSIRVADSVTFYPGSNSGSFFHGLQEGHTQAAPLVPELRKNAVNYVYLTFSTYNTSVDTRAFWDPDKDGGVGGEFTQDINTQSVLKVDVNVSTGSFPANTVPVAKITVGPVVITAIEDARDLMFRLGSGGINPNPFNTYAWRTLPGNSFARQEPTTQMLAGGVNPFQGADKNILTLKEWMDAVMSKLRELGGTTYWYDDTSSFSIVGGFYDALATAFKSKGKWVHDTVTPGLLTWTEDIQIKLTSDPRSYIIRQGSKTLADEQVMYLAMVRNKAFNVTDENVSWINGQVYVNTIGGAVGLFANLAKGDYIKKANDTIDKWVRVEEFYDAVNLGGSTTTAAGARSVRLSSAYLGVTGAEKGRYDKGVYLPADVVVSDRNQAAISNAGGQFHWLAIRSDTIENVGNAVTTSLSLAIDQHDGSTARVTSTAHGLVDGDRITIAGTTNFDGTYKVEVESANIFYINIAGGPFADEAGNGYYATITTVARTTPYGFQEESANHGFNSDDTITIDGTTNYDGNYEINVRTSTTFTIPVPGAAATETVGTASLARLIVRTEGAVAQIIQGQVIDIGGSVADNIRQYLGMASLSETAPTYSIPPSYNTLDGMANWNGTINESITARVSKLSAMMADKAQDKMIRALPSAGITNVNNTTNGSAQEITFTPAGASLTFITPGSDGQCFTALPSAAPGISLLVNQCAYVEIDRNSPTTGTIVVANIEDTPVNENIFLVAVRLAGPEVYLWEGSIIASGSVPGPGFAATVVNQNNTLKLVRGGTWSWGGSSTAPGNLAANVTGAGSSVNFVGAASPNIQYSQRFTAASSGSANSVSWYLRASSSPAGNVEIRIHADNGLGFPGALLGTSSPVAANTIHTGALPYPATTFTFTSPVSLIAGQVYHMVFRIDSLTSGTIEFAGSNGNPYAGGTVLRSNDSGGTWTDLAPEDHDFSVDGLVAVPGNSLSWDADAFIQIPSLPEARNKIAAGSVSLPNDGDVAYVDINRTAGANATLTVNVAAISALPLTTDKVIIARRTGSNVIVGSHSILLEPNESKKLYAGASNQTLSAIGLSSEVDKGPLRVLSQTASKRVVLSPIDTVVFDGTTWGNEISGLRMKFDGLQIDMETGNYYAYGDGTLAGSGALIGAAFTPTAFTSPNVYRWYSINLVADSLNADGTMNVKPLILAGADGSSSALAVKAPFSSKKIGQVLVQATGTGSTINNLVQTNIVQLASGAGGGGGTSPKLVGGGTFSWTESAVGTIASGTTNVNSFTLEVDTANKWAAQGFTAGLTRNITSVNFAMGKKGTPNFDIRLSIYTNNAGVPGTLLGSATVRPVSSISTNFNTFETFTFPTPVPVTAGTGYFAVVNIQNVVSISSANNLELWSTTTNHFAGFSVVNSFNGGSTWGADASRDYRMEVFGTVPQLSFTSNMYVEQARLNYADNTISTAVSPISLPTTNHVAFIDRLNASSGGPNLTVLTDLITNVKDGQIIIARRDGNDVIVGSTSNRLRDGESAKLFANRSNFNNQDNSSRLIEGGTWEWNVNTTSTQIHTPTAANNTYSIDAGFREKAAFRYIPVSTVSIDSMVLRLNQFAGATGNVFVTIYSASAGIPNALLYTSTNMVAANTLPGYQDITSNADRTFNFSGATLTAGTQYFFVLESTGIGPGQVMFASTTAGGPLNPTYRLQAGSWILDNTTPWAEIYGTVLNNALTWDAPAYIQIPGLAKTRNTIPASSLSILADEVAYVTLNRKAGAAANLAITVAAEASVPVGDDTLIIARGIGNTVQVGEMVLISGESKPLYAGQSDQLMSFTGQDNRADATPDYATAVPHTVRYITENSPLETGISRLDDQVDKLFGQARIRQQTVANQTVLITNSDQTVLDNTKLSLQLKKLLVDFTSGTIDFQAGTATPGVAFTAGSTIALNQYRWYSVSLIPSTVGADNRITAQLLVIPAPADGASAALAPRAAFGATGIKLGQVVVRNSGVAGVIASITQADIIQLGTGGGSEGAGDANELMERLKDRLVNAPFEWAEPNIFLQDEDNKIDTATAAFDVANTLYKFTAASQNIVSVESLDPEYLTETKDVDSVELMAFWNPGAIDANATYEVSRNGGVDWETMDMNRIGSTTETFRGILKFPQDTTYINLHEWPLANATAYREINTTALQAISQKFVVDADTAEVLQRTVLYINKVGSPAGWTYVQLVKDNGADKPSTNVIDIVAQTQVLNSTLAAGDNALTLSWGSNILAAGTYHLVIATDSTYKAGFTASVNSVRARVDAAAAIGPFGINELNAGVWTANATQTLIHRIEGRPLDLRVRITSSAANVELKGYGIFYGRQSQIQTGKKDREVVSFDGTVDNLNEFTVTNFLPDPDLLKVYHVETGQVYVYGTSGFILNGHDVIFPVDTFDGLGTVTLVFDQLNGTSFDNSDSNAALLTANFLGSTDPSIDRSQAGRGIFLRRPDGTLREITIDDSDNIVVYSV